MGTSSRQPNPMTISCRQWVLIFQPGPLWKVLMPTNYGAASRHQWVGVWITPGLLLNPSINRTRIRSICRELSQSSLKEVLLQRSPMFDCRWSWSSESGPVHLGRSGEGYDASTCGEKTFRIKQNLYFTNIHIYAHKSIHSPPLNYIRKVYKYNIYVYVYIRVYIVHH